MLYGLSVFAATVLGTMAVLGLIDYLLRLQDRGLRIIASLVLLGVLGWTLYRYLWTALFVRLRNADLALRVQLRFPALDDRLASAIEFLRLADDDPAAGSVALRRAVVARPRQRANGSISPTCSIRVRRPALASCWRRPAFWSGC